MSKRNNGLALGIVIGASVTLAVAAGYVLYTKNQEQINEALSDSARKLKDAAAKIKAACPCKASEEGENECFYAAGEEKNSGEKDIIINLDTDGDGTDDTVLFDTDGDGIADAAGVDVDGDGQIDAIITGIDGCEDEV